MYSKCSFCELVNATNIAVVVNLLKVELAGQILGNGIGVNKDFAKLQAAEEALRFLKTTTDPQIKKHLRPIRCSS